MADYRDAIGTTEKDLERIFKNSIPFWKIHNGGIVYTTSGQRIVQRLSNVLNISNITVEFLNEREIQTAGDCSVTTYDGFNLNFTAEFQPDEVSTLIALTGKDEHTYRALRTGVYEKIGDLCLLSLEDDDKSQKMATLIPDVTVRIQDVAGFNSGGVTQTVTFQAKDARAITVRNAMFSWEVWWDNGPSQPTGAGVTAAGASLTLGTGNYSYSSAPTAGTIELLDVDPDLTGIYKELIYLRQNGVDVTDDVASISAQVITSSPAFAATDKIEVCYIVNGALGTAAKDTPALKVQGGRNMAKTWKTYQQE